MNKLVFENFKTKRTGMAINDEDDNGKSRKLTLDLDNLPYLSAANQLKRINKCKYFELSEDGVVDVKLKNFSSGKDINEKSIKRAGFKHVGFSKQILCGVEENTYEKFHRRYKKKMKELELKKHTEKLEKEDMKVELLEEEKVQNRSFANADISKDTIMTLDIADCNVLSKF